MGKQTPHLPGTISLKSQVIIKQIKCKQFKYVKMRLGSYQNYWLIKPPLPPSPTEPHRNIRGTTPLNDLNRNNEGQDYYELEHNYEEPGSPNNNFNKQKGDNIPPLPAARQVGLLAFLILYNRLFSPVFAPFLICLWFGTIKMLNIVFT